MPVPPYPASDLLTQALADIAKAKRDVESADKAEADEVKRMHEALQRVLVAQQHTLNVRAELEDIERYAESLRLDTAEDRGQSTGLPQSAEVENSGQSTGLPQPAPPQHNVSDPF